MPIWLQQPQIALQSFLTPSSPSWFEDVPFCRFCLASIDATTQCMAIAPQLCTTLINTGEASLPPIATCLWCYPSDLHEGPSPPKYGSTPTTSCSIKASNMHPLPPPRSPPLNTNVAKASATPQPSRNQMQETRRRWILLLPTVPLMQSSQKWRGGTCQAPSIRNGVPLHSFQKILIRKLNCRQMLKQMSEVHCQLENMFLRTVWQWSARHGVFFDKATYRIYISMDSTPSAVLTISSLHDTGTSPNLIHKHFLLQACKDPMSRSNRRSCKRQTTMW